MEDDLSEPVPETAASNLAAQALSNLVNQFARPLDFLRELVQNSIDAGTPRIDIAVAWHPPEADSPTGILAIHVDDHGEGMDEDILDNQLTRLFSSTKENDLTKIGKFGIGFSSIFAVRPEAVLLRTGRHGQYWELLFHADRSFDKIRIDEPIHGTRITSFVRLSPDRVESMIHEIRFVLAYWCEHSVTPITFRVRDDAAGDDPHPSADSDAENVDPLEAFTEPAEPEIERIDRPLGLDATVQIRISEPGLELFVGVGEAARFGFYNGGLTLLNTSSDEVLGAFAPVVGHLIFKARSDRLEHTLTRDNVLQDENWEAVLDQVVRARHTLRERLVQEAVSAAADGSSLEAWHALLAAEVHAPDTVRGTSPSPSALQAIRSAPVLRSVDGKPRSGDEIAAVRARLGTVIYDGGDPVLNEAIGRAGIFVLSDTPGTRALLAALGLAERSSAHEIFVRPALVEAASLDAAEVALLRRVTDLLAIAVGVRFRIPGLRRVVQWAPNPEGSANRLTVRIGDFGGDLAEGEPLALRGPADAEIFLRPTRRRWSITPAVLDWRTLLVNRRHPLYRAQLVASSDDVDLAALALATALIHVEGVEASAAQERMLEATWDRVGAR